MIFLILALLLFVTYNLYVAKRFGILQSISESYYHVPAWMFTAFIAGISVSMILATQTPVMFCAGGLLGLVAMAPAFRREDMEKVHIFGAITGITLGFASITFEFDMVWPSITMLVFIGLALWKFKKSTYWIEVMAFMLIFAGLLISKL